MASRWHSKLIALVGLTVLALACGAAATAPGETGPAPAAGPPQYGGTFTEFTPRDPFDYDISYAGSTGINGNYIRLGYSALMRLKTGPNIDYSQRVLEPLLAERWEVSPDATTFTFHLRKGVKFADLPPVNGREFTAADVKFSYEYMARTGVFKKLGAGQLQWMFEGLESMQTPNPSTVVLKFKEAFVPFLYYAASSENGILPHEIYDQDGHFKDKLVGTGPFQPDFAASQKGSSWILKKNPTYFEKGLPYLDQVRILIIPDSATQGAAFQVKQVDTITTSDFRVAQEIRRATPEAVGIRYSNVNTRLVLSMTIPPLDNLKVRKAFSLALDRDEAIKVLQGGEGKWALQGTTFFEELFTEEEIKSFVKYDPAEAKRLLAEAGYPNGVTLEMRFTPSTANNTRLELIQAQVKKAGINMELKPMSAEQFDAEKRSGTFQMLVLGEPGGADLDAWLTLIAGPGSSFNYGGINDPKINELLVAERKEVNLEKRREIFRQLLRYANESAIMIPSWRGYSHIFMQPYVTGWHHQADYRSVGSVWNTWLVK